MNEEVRRLMSHPVARDFASRLAFPFECIGLLEGMPDACFYAKNLEGRFVMANAAQLALLGLRSPDELLGRSDHDFFEKGIADLYVAEDQEVFQGACIHNRKWMVPDAAGRIHWHLSSKIPLRGQDGGIIGLCGLLRDLQRSEAEIKPYADLSGVIRHINETRGQDIRIHELAGRMRLSVSQFDRKFKAFAGISPGAYVMQVRINTARQQLLGTDLTVAEIARDLGFYDQSFFTRQFTKIVGIPPGRFRKAQAEGGAFPAVFLRGPVAPAR